MKNEGESERTLSAIIEGYVIGNARTIRINTGDKIILLQVKGKRIVTTVYEQGSIDKVVFHGANSAKELISMFNELGISIWMLSKKFISASLFWKRNEILYLEVLPASPDK